MERGAKPPWAQPAAQGAERGCPSSQQGAQRAGGAMPGLASPQATSLWTYGWNLGGYSLSGGAELGKEGRKLGQEGG